MAIDDCAKGVCQETTEGGVPRYEDGLERGSHLETEILSGDRRGGKYRVLTKKRKRVPMKGQERDLKSPKMFIGFNSMEVIGDLSGNAFGEGMETPGK